MDPKAREWALNSIDEEWKQLALKLAELRRQGLEGGKAEAKLLKRQAYLDYLASEVYGKKSGQLDIPAPGST